MDLWICWFWFPIMSIPQLLTSVMSGSPLNDTEPLPFILSPRVVGRCQNMLLKWGLRPMHAAIYTLKLSNSLSQQITYKISSETPEFECTLYGDKLRNRPYPGKTKSLFLAMRSKRQIPPFHAKPVIISTRARQSIGTSEGIALTRGFQGVWSLVNHN